jgi:hypothetical protein
MMFLVFAFVLGASGNSASQLSTATARNVLHSVALPPWKNVTVEVMSVDSFGTGCFWGI